MRPLVERWVGRGDNIRADDAAVLAGCVRLLDRHRDRLVLDPPMLANTAATASHRALRLGRTAEARRLALLAARTRPTHLRHWARVGRARRALAWRVGRALRAHGVPTERRTMRPRVVALGSTTTRNRIGRVFSLWLTAREAGPRLHVPDRGRRSDVGATARPRGVPGVRAHRAATSRSSSAVLTADLGPDTTVLVCKPRPELVRLGTRIERRRAGDRRHRRSRAPRSVGRRDDARPGQAHRAERAHAVPLRMDTARGAVDARDHVEPAAAGALRRPPRSPRARGRVRARGPGDERRRLPDRLRRHAAASTRASPSCAPPPPSWPADGTCGCRSRRRHPGRAPLGGLGRAHEPRRRAGSCSARATRSRSCRARASGVTASSP